MYIVTFYCSPANKILLAPTFFGLATPLNDADFRPREVTMRNCYEHLELQKQHSYTAETVSIYTIAISMRRHCTTTTPLLHNHGTKIAQPQHHHRTNKVPALHNHGNIIAQTRSQHCTITAPSLHNHGTIIAQPQPQHCTTTAPAFHNHGTITAQPRHHHCTTTTTSLHHHCYVYSTRMMFSTNFLFFQILAPTKSIKT